MKTKPRADFWKQTPPELDPETGQVLMGGMWDHQKEWWDLPNFIRMLVTGYGGGKTLTLCKRMVGLTLFNAPAPCAIVSPTYTMALDTVIRTVSELLDGKKSLLRGFEWDYRKTSPYRFFINYKGRKGELLIYSGSDPDKLKGPNLGAVGMDEPFLMEQACFEQMMARIRHPDAMKRELNLAGTPEQLNWGYELAEGDLSEKHDVGIVQASSSANLATGAEYITRLEQTFDEKMADAYIHGQFVSLADGLVYYGFDPLEHVHPLVRPRGATLGVGMDFNVNPMAFVVFWRHGEHIHFFEEYELPNSDTAEACSLLYQKYWDQGLRDIYPDSTGGGRSTTSGGGVTDHTLIESAGFSVHCPPKGNPPPRDRQNAVNARLKNKQGRVRMTIGPNCKRMKRYLSTYAFAIMNKQEPMSHLLDAMGYAVNYNFPLNRDVVQSLKLSGY